MLPKQVALYVAMSPEATAHDDGGVRALLDALEADLRKQEHTVTVTVIKTNPTHPLPAPRVELQIVDADSGDDLLRGVGQFGFLFGAAGAVGGTAAVIAGSGGMTIDCYVVASNDLKPTFAGRINARAFSDNQGRDAVAAGANAGHAIGREIAN